MNQNAQKLRQALQQQSYLMMPAFTTGLSAKMAENAGFQAAFFSGGAFPWPTLGQAGHWIFQSDRGSSYPAPHRRFGQYSHSL